VRTAQFNSTCFSIASILLAVFLSLAPGSALFADDNTLSKEAKLLQLKKQIQKVRATLSKSTTQKNRLQHQLQKSETAIGNISRSLAKLATQLKQHKRELHHHQQEKKTKSKELKRQQQLLAQQIRASYAMGNQGYAKLLLNQEDPSAIGRTLVYYDYLNQSRTHNIHIIDERIETISRIEAKIQRQQKKISATQQQRKKEKEALEKQQRSRKDILSNISKDIKNQAQRLVQLEAAREELQRLLKSLSEALADIPPDVGNVKQFSQLKGKLPRPAQGKLHNRFGKHRKDGNLKWQGITINAKLGTEVKAIHYGRIAFSDWLRGFGLLVIIDHGDGYMSLYGHNESLYKDVGEWVNSGEVVATVGESGGQNGAALYFEIRKNGKPLNPKPWLARK